MPRMVKPYHFLIFVGPLLAVILLLYGMITWSIYVSFCDWYTMSPSYNFVGLKNYLTIFASDRFYIDLKNNILWIVLFMVPTAFLGLVLAYIIVSLGRGETVFRTIFLVPAAISFVVSGTLWVWMYGENGAINTLLDMLHLGFLKRAWIADPSTALYALIFATIWQYLGFAIIVFEAAIKGIDRSVIEAAIIDGASGWRLFRYIIVPQVRHAFLVVVPLLGLSALKIFDLVWVATHGGPGYATDVLAIYMWEAAFAQHYISIGAAIAVIMFVISLFMVVPYARMALKKWFGR